MRLFIIQILNQSSISEMNFSLLKPVVVITAYKKSHWNFSIVNNCVPKRTRSDGQMVRVAGCLQSQRYCHIIALPCMCILAHEYDK